MLSPQSNTSIGAASPYGFHAPSPQHHHWRSNTPQRQALKETCPWNEQQAPHTGCAAGEKRQATRISNLHIEHKRHCSDVSKHRLQTTIPETNSRKRASENAVAPNIHPASPECKKTKMLYDDDDDDCGMELETPSAMCMEEEPKKRDAAAEVWDFIGVG